MWTWLRRLYRWLSFPGPIPKGRVSLDAPAVAFQTGPGLIDQIVSAIALDQSVVLSGPRGCGKSHCVQKAIERAEALGIIPKGGSTFLQGNREIPRDYLIEDEIAFKTVPSAAGSGREEVVPYRRSAPLFRFAARTGEQNPDVDKATGRVRCLVPKTDVEMRRFVLFLDEINRFSDGVLDALLSILEERKAVLAGREYVLPVVVCMTMNPPGYDGSARKLSPPLAARIGRSYRLCSADLDTLGDQIIHAKMQKMAIAHHEEKGRAGGPAFPVVSMEVKRKVALVTLLCWGDVSGDRGGAEYLTADTRRILERVMAADPVVRKCMKTLADLCPFGPDGRAGADWLTTAVGLALTEARRTNATRAELRDEHLIRTAIESLSHKIYDGFSQASRPDLTAKKEQAVATICRQVLTRPWYSQFVRRTIDLPADSPESVTQPLRARGLLAPDSLACVPDLFRQCGVTAEEDVKRWRELFASLDAGAGNLMGRLNPGFIVLGDPALQLRVGLARVADDALARRLAECEGVLAEQFRRLLTGDAPTLGPRRPPWAEEMDASPLVRAIGREVFERVFEKHKANTLAQRLAIVRGLETLWAQPVGPGPVAEAVDRSYHELAGLTVAGRRLPVPWAALLGLLDPLLSAWASEREEEAVHYRRFLTQLRQRVLHNNR